MRKSREECVEARNAKILKIAKQRSTYITKAQRVGICDKDGNIVNDYSK